MRGAPTRLEMFVLRTARPPLHAAVTPRSPRGPRHAHSEHALPAGAAGRALTDVCAVVSTLTKKRVFEIMIRPSLKPREQSFALKFVSEEGIPGARQVRNPSEKRGF